MVPWMVWEKHSESNTPISDFAHVPWEGTPDFPKPPQFERTSEIETTLPENNMAPENGWLEDEFPFGKAYFQGLC